MSVVVSQQSWLGRIRESIKGFLFGLALFIAAFPVLFLNEGRAVRTEKSLKEGQGAVVTVPADRIDPANDQKLVHLSGQAATEEQLSDPEFGIAANAIKLRRKVEMYQWQEKKESTTEKRAGGSTETKTTYTYSKDWSGDLADSSSFNEASGHENPSSLPYQNHETVAQKVNVGAFNLTPSLISQMDDFENVPVNDQTAALPEALKAQVKVHDGNYYLGAEPAAPQIGDVRISFAAVKPAEVSVVSKQVGNSFEAYHATAGMDIEMLKRGVHTAKAMFESALAQNTMLTWILRAVGFIMMALGLVMFFRPLSVLGDVVPFIGSLLAFGTGIFALAISGALSVATIAVAWVVYRPVLGIFMLSVAIAALVALAMSGRKRAAALKTVPAS